MAVTSAFREAERSPPVSGTVKVREVSAILRELVRAWAKLSAVPPETLDAAAEAVMGETDLIGLVAASGQFVMTCCTANAFEVDPPADEPAPLRV